MIEILYTNKRQQKIWKLDYNKGIFYLNFRNNIYLFMLTFKHPWLFPKKDKNYLDEYTLYGWLFIYWGYKNTNNK